MDSDLDSSYNPNLAYGERERSKASLPSSSSAAVSPAPTSSGSSSIAALASTRSYPPCGNSFLHHLHTAPTSKHVNLPTSAPMSKAPSSASLGGGHYAPSPMPIPSFTSASPRPLDANSNSSSNSNHSQQSLSSSQSATTSTTNARASASPRMSPRTTPSPAPSFPEIGVKPVSRSRRRPSAAQMHSADDLVMPPSEAEQQSLADHNTPLQAIANEREGTGGRLSAPSLDRPGIPAPSPTMEPALDLNSRRPNLSWAEFGRQYARGRFDPVRIPCAPNADDTNPIAGPSRLAAGATGVPPPTIIDDHHTANSEPAVKVESLAKTKPAPTSAPTLGGHSQDAALPVSRPKSCSNLPTRAHDGMDDSPARSPANESPAALTHTGSAQSTETLSSVRSSPGQGGLSDSMSSRTDYSTSSSTSAWSRSHPDPKVVLPPPTAGPLLSKDPLPTIVASPAETPHDEDMRADKHAHPFATRTAAGALRPIKAASAPLEHSESNVTPEERDYFGPAAAESQASKSPLSKTASAEENESEPGSEPASTATASDPRPTASTNDSRPATYISEADIDLAQSQVTEWPTMRSVAQCETFYDKYGFLAAPHSPFEAQRLKALYSFNILHTAADINFDRIAHMIKLVFKAKMTFISLLDSESCWFKAKSGFAESHLPRTTSMCSHTILVDSDEPLVLLDTKDDWRFVNNPHVRLDPHVRFYAGAPLRTATGHNLGSLCIVDDQPRDEFPPRSRHILKEFAAIVMRELELWRDRLQLRTRDKIQTSMANFTRECLEIDDQLASASVDPDKSMDVVYSRAAKLVRNTLELDGCAILDISQFERTESTGEDGEPNIIYHATPYAEDGSRLFERAQVFGPVNAFPVLATAPETALRTRDLTPVEHERMSLFLGDYRDGRIFENLAPSWIRYIFPPSLKYGMVVPVIGIDKQPFALICAYTHDKGKQFLEGYELQFLRAIGVIILSAVLRRRMMVADRSKSVLISSVSHELRTPLHGILAASELMGDSKLDDNQSALLATVRTCGLQLIETVNHVLDYTKLSGAAKQGSQGTIKTTKVNLAELISQTVHSCWLGARGRSMQLGDSDVGSFYAPVISGLLPQQQRLKMHRTLAHVETVLDIGIREGGWNVICESGGLRRILMNLYGNSIKFTSRGYVQIVLREMPHPPGAKRVPVQMAVIDTGRGISKSFLRDQLFQPFSQENPMQPGTGLGLAIVNSIAHSEAMNGSVEVWSIEGEGTEIRVSFEVEVDDEPTEAEKYNRNAGTGYNIAFINFDPTHRGQKLMSEVMEGYAKYMGYTIVDDPLEAQCLIINELHGLEPEKVPVFKDKALVFVVSFKIYTKDTLRIMGLQDTYVRAYCKPMVRYSFLEELERVSRYLTYGRDAIDELQSLVIGLSMNEKRPATGMGSLVDNPMIQADPNAGFHHYHMADYPEPSRPDPVREVSTDSSNMVMADVLPASSNPRRMSAEHTVTLNRPALAPRGSTYHGPGSNNSEITISPTTSSSTISLADGGALLKAAAIPDDLSPNQGQRGARVLIVEDNVINRRVLSAFLRKRGCEFSEAVDGSAGVQLFEESSPNHWDVILMDITMPVMNGYEATRRIRALESARRTHGVPQNHTKIFALTGLAMQDDKRKAFGSGVDGYLVKPVSLASLDLLFKKIGF